MNEINYGEWIKWDGKETCPLNHGTRIQVKTRYGEVKEGRAGDFGWAYTKLHNHNIVAYRIKETKQTPDEDGWIKWVSGECPVDPDELVEVRLRDGYRSPVCAGKNFKWQAVNSQYDIVAYRVVGWIKYEGNGCPVDHNTIVKVKRRHGGESFNLQANSFDWCQKGEGEDIVAYQIVKARELKQPVKQENGWIEYDGKGECPVPGSKFVQVTYHNGSKSHPDGSRADSRSWNCGNYNYEIVAYRIVRPTVFHQEPIYLFLVQGMSDYMCCNKDQYNEFKKNPLVKTKIVYEQKPYENDLGIYNSDQWWVREFELVTTVKNGETITVHEDTKRAFAILKKCWKQLKNTTIVCLNLWYNNHTKTQKVNNEQETAQ